jgi:hypothetical protein
MDTEARQRLSALYQESFIAYRATAAEQREVAAQWPHRDEFSPDVAIEVLAVDIGGYVSQLIHSGTVVQPRQQAIQDLRRFKILDDPSVAWLYHQDRAEAYPHLKRYVELLERLRREALALLESA